MGGKTWPHHRMAALGLKDALYSVFKCLQTTTKSTVDQTLYLNTNTYFTMYFAHVKPSKMQIGLPLCKYMHIKWNK